MTRSPRRSSRTTIANLLASNTARPARSAEFLSLEPRVFLSVGGVDLHDDDGDHEDEPHGTPGLRMDQLTPGQRKKLKLAAAEMQAGATSGAAVPVTGGVPLLSSNPAARAKIYLDFDGDAARAWGSYSVPATPAYDADGNTGSFSDAELGHIHEIWARVAEKYSPFNVDVTTVNPGALTDKLAMKIVIGGNGAWFGAVVVPVDRLRASLKQTRG